MTGDITRAGGISVNDYVRWRIAGSYDAERHAWSYGHGQVLRIFRHHPGEGLAGMVHPDDTGDAEAFRLSSLEKIRTPVPEITSAAVREALAGGGHTEWVPGEVTGFHLGEDATEVLVERLRGPDMGEPYTDAVKAAERTGLDQYCDTLRQAGYIPDRAWKTHGHRMIVLAKPARNDDPDPAANYQDGPCGDR